MTDKPTCPKCGQPGRTVLFDMYRISFECRSTKPTETGRKLGLIFVQSPYCRAAELEAEVERLKEEIRVKDDTICNMRYTILVKSDDFHKERKALLSLLDDANVEIAKLREIIRDLVGGGIIDIDPRLNYVEIQVSRRELADAREAIELDG